MNVGDRVVVVPSPGGKVAVPVSNLSVGDRVTVLPTRGGPIVIRPVSPSVGDKALTYPVRSSGRVCLAALSDDEGAGDVVKPPLNFNAARTGFETADLNWTLNTGNTGVRIVRRHDRYPIHINDGTIVHDGPGTSTEDTGLDTRYSYYYCAWGKSGSRYSSGYLMDRIYPMGGISGTYYLHAMDIYHVGSGGTAGSFTNCLGNTSAWTLMGYLGWFEARFSPGEVYWGSRPTTVTIFEQTSGLHELTILNPEAYIYPNYYTWDLQISPYETYRISFKIPDIVRIQVMTGEGKTGTSAHGNIVAVRAVVSE